MDLGCFSLSLAVKDLAASRRFYEAVGFKVIDGKEDQHWLILENGEARLGLFEGMFEKNAITFNPPDARAAQAAWEAAGFKVDKPCEGESGPTHCVITDPDGNGILVDQHTA